MALEKYAKFTAHKHEDYQRRFWLELTLGGDGQPERSRCVGDVLTKSQCYDRERAAAAALILAGYAITA
ncbi:MULTISPECIES: hypothetical protein [unclassified Agrobacterium]|uniref:hypothetical protein n=1 Tax=unclassified Agrobacterium TaxID=2632611 RepID=UPI00244ABE82|nr:MULTISPECIES: hypothetical protein [unclassified Agrobacterium]MDH0613316.1 hypothetical protein [Agrobacterium sp. GD03872]MDH0697233.1 hypothetical protein [Agrobacterium sp. GD03871]MDH1062166.1 hypothetical protein [Agrobacterium sp. GD03992]MDH2211340.1 hypothetical protein [Agrobacterium sp. GD03643]MDH2220599.1 hypothetical protein [Agrobacterium sp. GD03638]